VVSASHFRCWCYSSSGADVFRFTGPKITLSEDDLTDEQQEALKTEGLEVKIEPRSDDGTQNAPISKDLEKS
jgi:hypothetical protein